MTRRTRGRDTLAPYLRDVGATALLSREEERDLARRIARGDAEARSHLIRANLRLVVAIARVSRSSGLDLEDRIGEGNRGLIRAVEGFDPAFGTRFSTYATYWIRQAIQRAGRDRCEPLRVPAYAQELADRVEGGKVKAADLPDGKREAAARAAHLGSLMTMGDNDVEEGRIGDVIPDPAHGHPCDRMLAAERAELLHRAVAALPPAVADVIARRYGLDGREAETLEAVGARRGVGRERVRQVQDGAIKALRGMLAGAMAG